MSKECMTKEEFELMMEFVRNNYHNLGSLETEFVEAIDKLCPMSWGSILLTYDGGGDVALFKEVQNNQELSEYLYGYLEAEAKDRWLYLAPRVPYIARAVLKMWLDDDWLCPFDVIPHVQCFMALSLLEQIYELWIPQVDETEDLQQYCREIYEGVPEHIMKQINALIWELSSLSILMYELKDLPNLPDPEA